MNIPGHSTSLHFMALSTTKIPQQLCISRLNSIESVFFILFMIGHPLNVSETKFQGATVPEQGRCDACRTGERHNKNRKDSVPSGGISVNCPVKESAPVSQNQETSERCQA
jgi:hypothetical protein